MNTDTIAFEGIDTDQSARSVLRRNRWRLGWISGFTGALHPLPAVIVALVFGWPTLVLLALVSLAGWSLWSHARECGASEMLALAAVLAVLDGALLLHQGDARGALLFGAIVAAGAVSDLRTWLSYRNWCRECEAAAR